MEESPSFKDKPKTEPAFPIGSSFADPYPANKVSCNHTTGLGVCFSSEAEASALLHWGQLVGTPGGGAVSDKWQSHSLITVPVLRAQGTPRITGMKSLTQPCLEIFHIHLNQGPGIKVSLTLRCHQISCTPFAK